VINILLGSSGSGKSFEAVAFHALRALSQGRKIITNLPLVLDEICKINPKYRELIDLRQSDKTVTVTSKKYNFFHRKHETFEEDIVVKPFAHISDYGDAWRHPDKGFGPLYIIDECHKSLLRGHTSVEVEEWFAEHRHEFADVLLITQSYGKVSKSIIDNVQLVYRVRKATAFGSDKSYIRKVQDGVRGEVMNETIRKYKPEFFKYYISHTKSASVGTEDTASDVVPIWKRWPFVGASICLVIVVLLLVNGASVNPMEAAKPVQVREQTQEKTNPIRNANYANAQKAPVAKKSEKDMPEKGVFGNGKRHPFDGLNIHISAYLESSERWLYHFIADRNAQERITLTQKTLMDSGYVVERLSDCSAVLRYEEVKFFVVCDSPSVGMGSHMPSFGS